MPLENAFRDASSPPSSRVLAKAEFVWAAQLLVRSDIPLTVETDVSSVARSSELAGAVLERRMALALVPEAPVGSACDTTLGLGLGYECWLRTSLVLLLVPLLLLLLDRVGLFCERAKGGAT